MPDFMAVEADATLQRSSPVAWAFIRARGLLEAPAPPIAGVDAFIWAQGGRDTDRPARRDG
jgi:hypothetical protein